MPNHIFDFGVANFFQESALRSGILVMNTYATWVPIKAKSVKQNEWEIIRFPGEIDCDFDNKSGLTFLQIP